MAFAIVGDISQIETFAAGGGTREIARLRRIYGQGRWRKRKVSLRCASKMARYVSPNYWYEAAGIGRQEFKIKHFL
jgi:hypothetical protein